MIILSYRGGLDELGLIVCADELQTHFLRGSLSLSSPMFALDDVRRYTTHAPTCDFECAIGITPEGTP